MAKLIPIERDTHLVFDLMWASLPDSSATTVNDAAGEAVKAVVVKNDVEEVSAGFLTLSEGQKPKGKYISFAALMAAKTRDETAVLVFIDMDDGNSAMAAIRRGLPVPDCDRYGSREELRQVAEEFLEENPGAKILGKTTEFGPDIEPFELDVFLEEKQTSKLRKAAILKSVRKSNRVTLLIIIVLIVAAYVGHDWYQTREKEKALAKEVTSQKTPEQTYAEALPAAVGQEGMSREKLDAILKMALGSQISGAGWKVSAIKCDAGGCGATWVRDSKTATFEDLLAFIGRSDVTLTTNDAALKMMNATAGEPLRLNPSKLPVEQDAWIELLTPLQKAGGLITFGVTRSAMFSAGGVTAQIPGRIMRGEIKIKGPLWATEYLQSMPHWAAVKSINFSLKDEASSSMDADVVFFHK